MANKPLKSIKFPGLNDTYTVPEVDATLATTGAAADAKKVGDEINDLKAELNSINLAVFLYYNSENIEYVTDEYQMERSAEIVYYPSANYKTLKNIPVSNGTFVIISGDSGINNSETVLVSYWDKYNHHIGHAKQTNIVSYSESYFSLPNGTDHISVTFRKNSTTYNIKIGKPILDAIENNVALIESVDEKIEKQIGKYETITLNIPESTDSITYLDVAISLEAGDKFYFAFNSISYENYDKDILIYVNNNGWKHIAQCKYKEAIVVISPSKVSNIRLQVQRDGNSSSGTIKLVVYKLSNNNKVTDVLGYLTEKEIDLYEKIPEVYEYKMLILGDSYSQGGNWIRGMQEKLNITSLVNLSVGSASVKDQESDRVTYPYTSRPVQSNSAHNNNTFMCQIEKLKRLMEGTDLDEGEEQIYKTESEYPNIIIIEGGQNDIPYTSEKLNNYPNQFMERIDNVYVASRNGQTPELTFCHIKPDIEDIDRTSFAGAYRSIIEELHSIFPKAKIYMTSRSLLGYWKNNHFPNATDIYNQQKLCAQMCGIGFIDWQIGTMANTIWNYISGKGTQEDPYLYAVANTEEYLQSELDSLDLLHPTIRGGKKLGYVAAMNIKNTFWEL